MTAHTRKITQARGKKISPKAVKSGAAALGAAMMKPRSTKAMKEKSPRKVKKI
jgi:hypothetical protein